MKLIFPETVWVLGTLYKITQKTIDEDKMFTATDGGQVCGYCNSTTHEIVLLDLWSCDMFKNYSDAEIIAEMTHNVEHEIVHAFFGESGLADNSNTVPSWAVNEEMVDWIALQGRKIVAAWDEVREHISVEDS